jgi:hypothetical protein
MFTTVVKVANSIETPVLWIHQFMLKMVEAWPAPAAPVFSMLLSRLDF